MSAKSLAQKAYEFQQFFFFNLGGPLLCKMHYLVNIMKGSTFIWVVFLIIHFNNYSTGMCLYLFLHGSYGIAWLIKYTYFPDLRGNRRGTLLSQIALFVLLAAYWIIPVPLALGKGVNEPSFIRGMFLISIYVSGLVLMMGSDYQKWHALKKKKGLVSTGFFALTRNPNYLGQLMVYSSFVLCAGNLLGYLIFYGLGGSLFALNIFVKEELSFKKKQGWQEYSKRSYIFLPKLFKSLWLNLTFYFLIFVVTWYFLAQQPPSEFFYPLGQWPDI